MGENKRYYWLKLQENFFDDDTIDFIESQENGEKYVLFYLKLCLKALKNEGKLIRYVGEMLLPFDDLGLSKITRTDVDTVRSALILFSKIGLIKKLDTGEIFLTQLNEMVGTETQKAKYMRERRLQEKNNGVTMLPECYPNVTQSIENRDRVKEIEQEKEQEGCVPSYIQKDIDKTKVISMSNVIADIYEIIKNHNQDSKKKIPISKDVFQFQCKEGRMLSEILNGNAPQVIINALKNYLSVANMDSWKTSFSFNAFCKNYVEYTDEFFDVSKYDKETDTEKICDNFIKQMEKVKGFDTGAFWQNRMDWLEKGRPQGEKYFQWQEEKYKEMGL